MLENEIIEHAVGQYDRDNDGGDKESYLAGPFPGAVPGVQPKYLGGEVNRQAVARIFQGG